MLNETPSSGKVAYVVKRYPRFSETFVVNEILAHEAAGVELEIFSCRPPSDTHFQDLISKVRSPLTYLSSGSVRADELWKALGSVAGSNISTTDSVIREIRRCSTLDTYCGLQLARFVRERNITHLHAHFASSAAAVARIASKFTAIPYSITAHAKDIFHEEVSADELQEKLVDAKAVFTVSKFNVDHLREAFPTASEQIQLLYNGIHLADFPFQAPVERTKTILAVGRFVEKKGFDVLLAACRLLVNKQVNFECHLVGSGEREAQLQSLITEFNLQSVVKIVGPQPQATVKKMMHQAAVLAAPCIDGSDGNRDGLPTVLLEAMALGTPCISTNVTGIPELVRNENTGLLVPQRDAEALAIGLQRCLEDVDLRVRLANNASRLIQQQFDAVVNAEKQRQVFFSRDSSDFESPAIGRTPPKAVSRTLAPELTSSTS